MPTLTDTVREIALNQPSSIRVFEQFGIDYCCGGRKPLAVACTEQDVELGSVLAALSAAEQSTPGAQDRSKESLESLITHIVSTHHAYVKQELPRLDTLARKVIARHGATHAELARDPSRPGEVGSGADAASCQGGERFCFLTSQSWNALLADGGAKPQGCFGTVANPIAMMTQEHEAAGTLLAEIKDLSSHFTTPPDACPTYHAFFDGLKEFEQDLHQHIHLENNILFPRAIAMEASQRLIA